MKHKTILESLTDSISRAADHNRNVEQAPAVVLWTDHDRLWEPLIPELKARLPHLISLGDWKPGEHVKTSGPAYWIRCAIARKLDDARWEGDVVPVVYLPGVSRSELRQVNICPPEWRPLAELQYRGTYWTQANAKDWTPYAFLTSAHGGLGLDVAGDADTKNALAQSLVEVFTERVVRFEGKRVDGDEIRRLLDIDLDRDILRWMNGPAAAREGWKPAHWDGLCKEARARLKLDPAKEDAMSAAELLASQEGEWKSVWLRFREAPTNFPEVRKLLARLQQPVDLLVSQEAYPSLNAKGEAELRDALSAFADIRHAADARARIAQLDAVHGVRRSWVWAELGESPVAMALGHLVELARLTQQPLTTASIEAMRVQYEETAWQVDAAMIDALASVREDASTRAVEAALAILYKPWLEEHAERFQTAVKQHSYPLKMPPTKVETEAGLVVFFVDGLRYDAGKKLAAALQRQGTAVALNSVWTAVPSVTASGKVLASPAAVIALAEPTAKKFEPIHKTKRQPFRSDVLRKTLEELGWQVLTDGEVGDPTGCAWTENGNLDSYGHAHGLRLARDLAEQLDRVRERINQLLAAGWKKVRVVTDHGWLLVPGKLDKVDFDKYLAEVTWGRAAQLKSGSTPPVMALPWTWCDEVQIALAPGAKSFKAGEHYSHGGLSLQESLTPIVEVTGAGAKDAKVAIKSFRWTGMRLRVTVDESQGAKLTLDVRTKASDAESSLVVAQELAGGEASVVVKDLDREGEGATLVIVDDAGNVVAKKGVTIGKED